MLERDLKLPIDTRSTKTVESERSIVDASFSSLLDGLRWTAAIIVTFSHIRALIWVQGSSLEKPNIVIKGFYAVTSMGVEAVATFFVLSGYLVGGVNYARFMQGSFDLRRYGIDRFTRIYTVLLLTLPCVSVLDITGRALFARSGYYSGASALIAERFGAFPMPSLSGYMTNVAALQDFYAPVFGSNIPLWSLSYEIWFYVLAGAMFFAGSAARGLRLAIVIASIGIVLILGAKFVFFLAVWLIGVAAHRLSRTNRYTPTPIRWLMLAMLPIAMLASDQTSITVKLGQAEIKPMLVAVALICGAVLVTWRHADHGFLQRTRRFNAFLASFSFSLYLLHFPAALLVISGVVAMMVPDPSAFTGFQPFSFAGSIAFVCATIFASSLALVTAALSEWRIDVFRARLLSVWRVS